MFNLLTKGGFFMCEKKIGNISSPSSEEMKKRQQGIELLEIWLKELSCHDRVITIKNSK